MPQIFSSSTNGVRKNLSRNYAVFWCDGKTVHRQIQCARDVDGQHSYVKDVVLNSVLYREAVREISQW